MVVIDKKIKKWFIIETIFVIILGSLLHFVYEWSGNNRLVGLFSTVNESTWEHLKLLFWPSVIFSIIEYFIFGKDYDNFIPTKAISLYTGIILIVVIFYTYTGVIGEHYLILDILTFIISVIISQYIGYKVLISGKYNSNLSLIISTLGIMILILAFMFFTFNPPNIKLFEDPKKKL